MNRASERRRSAVYAAAFALCAILVGGRRLASFDLQTTLLLQHWGRRWLDEVLFGFTLIGSIESTALLVAGLGLWHWRAGRRRTTATLWIIFAALTTVELLLKWHLPQPHVPAMFNRSPAPGFLFVHVPTPYAFPSGHTLRSVFLLGYVGDLIISGHPRSLWRRAVQTLFVTLILLVGISRIYLGDHWASDVIGGVLLAAAGLWWMQGNHRTAPS